MADKAVKGGPHWMALSIGGELALPRDKEVVGVFCLFWFLAND